MRSGLQDQGLISKCAYAMDVEGEITNLTFFCGSEGATGPRPVDFRFRGRPGPRRAGLRGVSSFLKKRQCVVTYFIQQHGWQDSK